MDNSTKGRESSLGKALRLLSAVSESPSPDGISVVDLVHVTGLSRPTTYRFLNELQDFGLIRSVPNQALWQVGPKVIALAAMSGSWSVLRRRARQAMDEFVRRVGYTVHLGIRDGNEVVYIDKAENPDNPSISSVIGQRRPIHVTALGKCLVAFDANASAAAAIATGGLAPRTERTITDADAWIAAVLKTRAEGLAFDDGECDLGARCVAAPILDAHGYAIAAVSLTALTRPGDIDVWTLGDEVRALAGEIGTPVASHRAMA